MLPTHTVILKANQGEFDALRNLDARTADKLRPLFEVGRLTDELRKRKYIGESTTPVMTHLNRVLDSIAGAWPARPAMVDGYTWAPNAQAENGQHVIAYMVSRLSAAGVPVIPVVGYDRWENEEYRLGLKAIPRPDSGLYCLRLDNSAVEDSAEPEHFQSTIQEILDELDLEPARCSALIDFADVSMDAMSVEALVSSASALIRQLQKFGFQHYVVAGCSLPSTINLAVNNQDSTGSVLRKEMLVWQALRLEFPETIIINGDYAVRGPTTTEVRSKYTNGKIRYTIKKQMYVVRGHPIRNDHSLEQMHDLSAALTESTHFLGGNFSWGDNQVLLCKRRSALGGLTRWIAIDTNHHLTFVVQEVEEFERDLVVARPAKVFHS